MLVRELMTSPVISIPPTARLKEAMIVIDQAGITSLPVVDEEGRLVGVISEANLIEDAVLPDERLHLIPIQMDGEPRPQRVADAMTHHVMSIDIDADVADAVDLMTSSHVKSIPVTSHERVVGMLSRRDIVHALATRDTDLQGRIDELIRKTGHDWYVEVDEGVVDIDGPSTEPDRQLALTLAGSVTGVVAVHVRGETRV
jgi:CBS domain-containing protein